MLVALEGLCGSGLTPAHYNLPSPSGESLRSLFVRMIFGLTVAFFVELLLEEFCVNLSGEEGGKSVEHWNGSRIAENFSRVKIIATWELNFGKTKKLG